MLTPAEIAALVTATKGAVDLFDKLAGPIKRVLLGTGFNQADAKDQRWRFKVNTSGSNIVVNEKDEIRQTIKGDDLAKVLGQNDLALVQTYEQKMQEYFDQWRAVYAAKDASNDALANAKTETQLKNLIVNMRGELLGILAFLEQIGVHLDDHYMHVRKLVKEKAK